MLSSRRYCLACAHLVVLASGAASFADPPARAETWALIFEDNFDGASLDTTKWSYNYPWGQTHNHRAWVAPENVKVSGGILKITAEARRHPQAPNGVTQGGTWYSLDYTSGAIHTQGKLNFTRGYMEGRFRMPAARGTWPAFWTLNGSGAWPPEIDVLEVPHERNRFYYNYHYGADWQDHHSFGGDYWGPDLSEGFHVFGCEWDVSYIAFFLDGQEVRRFESSGVLAQSNDMYMILNLAVGGWAGDPPANSVFPDDYEVDWVRVYKHRSGAEFTWAVDGNGEWKADASWSGASSYPFLASDRARFPSLSTAKSARVDWSGVVAVGHLEIDSNVNYTLGAGNERLLLARTSDAPATLTGLGAGAQSIAARTELHSSLEIDWGATQPLVLRGPVSGAGGISVKRGRVLVRAGSTYSGDTSIDGGEFVYTGATPLTGKISVLSGSLGGTGNIDGAVTVASGASLEPGDPIGTLTLKTLTLSPGSKLRIELGNGPPQDFLKTDRLTVTGATLEVSADAALDLGQAREFDILDGAVIGQFARQILPELPPGLEWDSSRLHSEGVLKTRQSGASFRRGDANQSGAVDLSDAITILGHLFLGNPETLGCAKAADVDDLGTVDLSDAVYLLNHLFSGAPAPRFPHPACGIDPTPDALTCLERCPDL